MADSGHVRARVKGSSGEVVRLMDLLDVVVVRR